MRILMLAQFYPPVMGGEEQHVRTLSRALAQRGHKVSVATLWHPGLPEFEQDGDVAIHRLHSLMGRASGLYSDVQRPHAPPFPDPEAMLGLRTIIAREQPEIVHAHNWLLHSFLPLKRLSGARLIVTLHDYSFACVQKRLMRKGMPCEGPGLHCVDCAMNFYGAGKGLTTLLGNTVSGQAEARLVDMFLAVSQATAAGNGLDRRRLPYRVIPNFLLDERNAEDADIAEYMSKLPDEPFMLFVGDVVPDKGVGTLLQAYAAINDPPPLVLIGRFLPDSPGPLPPGVIAQGSWPHAAVMQAWSRSLFGLLPSETAETFGIAALEAMAAGRPVIASRIGGLADIVDDGVTGLLVPPADPQALRAAIERLLAEPSTTVRMGKAAAQRAGAYRASQVVPLIEQVYEEVVQSASGDKLPARAMRGQYPSQGRQP